MLMTNPPVVSLREKLELRVVEDLRHNFESSYLAVWTVLLENYTSAQEFLKIWDCLAT